MPADRLRVIVNEDNDHYFKRGAEWMNESALRAYVTRYASYGVDTIAFCVNGQRCSYRSNVLDAIWDPLQDGTEPDADWARNAKSLHTRGIDPYAIWLDECRRTGIHLWISIRVNDMHHVHPSLRFRADRRWFTHPEWTRDPARFDLKPNQSWEYYQALQEPLAWNFAHPDVRRLMVAFLNETVERYDADGFEIDFSRDFFCLTPRRAAEDAPYLTELLRVFRQTLDTFGQQRDHAIQLVVRVPWTPAIAASWGFDVRQWAAEKLIDCVVATPYWRSFQYDFPLQIWRETVGNGIQVIPAVDQWVCAAPSLPLLMATPAFLRGWCAVMASQKADAVYFFNYPYRLDTAEDFVELSKSGLDRILQTAAPRCTQAGYVDFPPEGVECTSEFPVELDGQTAVVIHLPFGDIPAGGYANVRPEFLQEEPPCRVEIKLNGIQADAQGNLPADALRVGVNEIILSGGPCTLTNLFLRWER